VHFADNQSALCKGMNLWIAARLDPDVDVDDDVPAALSVKVSSHFL
jgi:hypothetical protein